MAKLILHPLWRSLIAAGAISLAMPAFADDDDCEVPMANWQPRSAVIELAESKGWAVRRIKIEEGCYAVYARDAQGRQVEVHLNPATLQILRIEGEEGHDDHRKDKSKGDHD